MSAPDVVKLEDDVKIKPDPATASLPSGMEEDEYEDTGELVIPGTADESRAWLAKLPKWLWEAWATIAEDEELQLGKVRVYHDAPDGKQKVRELLVHCARANH